VSLDVEQNSSELTGAFEPGAQSGYLLGQLLRFGRLLRVMGVETSLRQMLDLVAALEYVSIANRLDFYCAARALLVMRREDLLVFDQAFAIFWNRREGAAAQPPGRAKESEAKPPQKQARLPRSESPAASINRPAKQAESRPDQDSGDSQDDQTQITKIAYYSPIEVNRQKDFREMTWEEIQAARHAMNTMEWKLGMRRTRRYQRGRRGRLHLRRMMRDNLRYGGEVLTLAYRTYALHPRPLVVLCDISGSMERYSRMLLHFIHALTHHWTGVDMEAFAFGTRLTRITHHLRHKDVDESLDELGKRVKDWSGGTRIGETIKTFNFKWARRVLGRGAVVLIISDGWDRGDSQLLATEMARLQRSSYRVMWLNPLLGAADYQPSQHGMAAAKPFVDDFLPGSNLANLEQLAKILSSIAMRRPERRQNARLSQLAKVKPKIALYESRAARTMTDLPSGLAAGG
jgi:uncharacterized protein with von Willebrand factor type A (vWA) domain